jgi:hypothetical protein
VSRGRIAPGLKDRGVGTAQLTPAAREVSGTFCLRNTGARTIGFFGVPSGGRTGANPVKVTVNGRPVRRQQLSVTLLSNPSQSLLGRMGDVLDHAAAFRPVSTWMLWLLLLLLLIGAPVALALALARAVAADDPRDAREPSPPDRP